MIAALLLIAASSGNEITYLSCHIARNAPDQPLDVSISLNESTQMATIVNSDDDPALQHTAAFTPSVVHIDDQTGTWIIDRKTMTLKKIFKLGLKPSYETGSCKIETPAANRAF